MTRLHSLADLSTLFGPDAKAPVIKNGASAEAARREDQAMETVQVIQPRLNRGTEEFSSSVHPVFKVRDGVVTLTADDARAILKRTRYALQKRDLTHEGQIHIDVLADIMRRKQWRDRDQIEFALVGNVLTLINGHHRLGGQGKSGQDITWNIVIHRCDDQSDIERLYYTFDTNVRKRSNETILTAMDAASKFGLMKTTAEALYRTVPLLYVNFDFAKNAQDRIVNRVIDRRMEVMRQYAAEARAWEAAVKTAPSLVRRKLTNQGAFAVALTAFKHRPYEAQEFYEGLAKNDMLPKGDPRHTYLTALLTGTVSASGGSSYTARQAAIAWNAWVKRKSLSILKIYEDRPLVIAGTPVGR